MSSQRYPGKVLYKINGKPILHYLLSSLKKCQNSDQIVIATSIDSKDDFIEAFCIEKDIPCFRGPLEDVAKRMLDAAQYYKKDAFVRISGDSPLIDPCIIIRAIQIYQNGEYDLITNVFPRSFPVGQSVEVIRTSTFNKIYNLLTKPAHFEHVTKYYYEEPNKFRIKNFKNNKDLSSYRMVVDTLEDLKRMKKIIGSMTKPHTEYSLDELIELYPSS